MNGDDAKADKKNGKKKAEPEADEIEIKTEEVQPQNVKEEESKEQREAFLRLAAEFDNYKRRVQKELEESSSMGRAALTKDMLPVIDEFELALMALDKSGDKTMTKGIEMLYSNFIDVLKKGGLKEIKCDGMFDPYRHEIVMVRESKEREGTILEIIKKGYEFSGKLLRPSSVIVAKAPAKKEEKEITK